MAMSWEEVLAEWDAFVGYCEARDAELKRRVPARPGG